MNPSQGEPRTPLRSSAPSNSPDRSQYAQLFAIDIPRSRDVAERPANLAGRIKTPGGHVDRFDNTPALRDARNEERNVLVILWATWCAPCIEELPALRDLQKSSTELVIVGLLDELLTPTSRSELSRQLKPYPELRFNYYILDESLKRELFDSVPGDKEALPAFVLLGSTGRRLSHGRGVITADVNANAFNAMRQMNSRDGKGTARRPDAERDELASRNEADPQRYLERCVGGAAAYKDITRDIRSYFKTRGMDERDADSVINSFVKLLRDPARWSSAGRGTSRQRVVLWVDVTCELCMRAADVVQEVVDDPDRVQYEVVGTDATGEHAAGVLELIRQRNHEDYSEAVEEFITVLPRNRNALTHLTQKYLDTDDVEALPGWQRAIAAVRGRTEKISKLNQGTPFAIIDGFRVSRDDRPAFGEMAFDPFVDQSLLRFAMRAVRACRGSHGIPK